MSIKYIVHTDLLQIAGGLKISSAMQQRINEVQTELETNPRPTGCEPRDDGGLKLWIAHENEELAIIYMVYEKTREIFILRIEPASWMRKAISAIDDLFRFAP